MRTLAELATVKVQEMTPAEREAAVQAACEKLRLLMQRDVRTRRLS